MDHTTAQQPLVNYAHLLQSSPSPFILFGVDDPLFTILEENDAHAKVANVKRSEIIGKPVLEIFPDVSKDYIEHGRSKLIDSIRKVIKTKKPDTMPNLHYDIKNKDGVMETRYWSVKHHPIIENGDVVGVYQSTEDITQEMVAQQRLINTQYQLDQVLQVGNVGTWNWNVSKRTVSGDPNMAKLFGLDSDALVKGLPSEEFDKAIHSEDRERVREEFADAATKLRPYECEYRTIDADGEVHWVAARGYFDNSSGDVQSPGVISDITDRRHAEDNLKLLTNASTQFSAELGYRKTLSNIANLVVPSLADWCAIELVEGDHLEQVAIAHRDPAKVKWAKELHRKQGDTKLDSNNGAARVVRTGEVEYYPEITREMLEKAAKDNEELELILELGFSSVIIAPMTIDNKCIGALTFVASDSHMHYKPSDVEVARTLANRAALAVYNATLYEDARHELKERRALQKDLLELNDKLESRVAERTEELQATNKGLEREIRKRQRAEKALDEYSKELARSNQELQDFAYVASHDLQEPLRKIQAFGDVLVGEYGAQLGEDGREYLHRMHSAASRMSILIQDLLSFSRVTTKTRPSTAVDLTLVAKEVMSDLETRISSTNGMVKVGKLPIVWADETHMRQLFQNLIANALKFHRPGVDPIVEVGMKTVKPSDKFYTITFKDNGIGFEEKYLDRIFSVFQRLHGKGEYEGTGIGLAVCRKIAERYGGTITAESKQGAGSTFIFTIPVTGEELTYGRD